MIKYDIAVDVLPGKSGGDVSNNGIFVQPFFFDFELQHQMSFDKYW